MQEHRSQQAMQAALVLDNMFREGILTNQHVAHMLEKIAEKNKKRREEGLSGKQLTQLREIYIQAAGWHDKTTEEVDALLKEKLDQEEDLIREKITDPKGRLEILYNMCLVSLLHGKSVLGSVLDLLDTFFPADQPTLRKGLDAAAAYYYLNPNQHFAHVPGIPKPAARAIFQTVTLLQGLFREMFTEAHIEHIVQDYEQNTLSSMQELVKEDPVQFCRMVRNLAYFQDIAHLPDPELIQAVKDRMTSGEELNTFPREIFADPNLLMRWLGEQVQVVWDGTETPYEYAVSYVDSFFPHGHPLREGLVEFLHAENERFIEMAQGFPDTELADLFGQPKHKDIES